jgi:hypothetical protein
LWFGIFAPNHIRISIDNISVEDWGINEYNIKDSSIRKYFKSIDNISVEDSGINEYNIKGSSIRKYFK